MKKKNIFHLLILFIELFNICEICEINVESEFQLGIVWQFWERRCIYYCENNVYESSARD